MSLKHVITIIALVFTFSCSAEEYVVKPGDTFYKIVVDHYRLKSPKPLEVDTLWEIISNETHHGDLRNKMDFRRGPDFIEAGKSIELPFLPALTPDTTVKAKPLPNC